MSLFARFYTIDENGKAQAVRRLMESSTPDFDYFYMVTLSVAMATLGLLIDSSAVVIGSMLIAPVLFPLLSFSLGIVMSDYTIFLRSLRTLLRSILLGVGVAALVTFVLAHDADPTMELLKRAEPTILYFFVAVVAGLAGSYALARPDWNEAIPGIAISVALIPPLGAVGVGIATLNVDVISGATSLFIINFVGIVLASLLSFSLMNLYEKRNVAKSTIEKEEEKVAEENEAVAEHDEEAARKKKQEANDE